ncbi:glucans biosynthesis protein D precursor [Halomonas elongata]|uniref:Glucans biosynthesis protein D n=1 Tax=Halomonas elongata TaxID=2746 RepID=A0A1B8P576_HALEL|nr:glucans biosynthesis protein D precursor [Halomonas elongata]
MKRRDFLKITGALGGSGLLPISTLLAAAEHAGPGNGAGEPFDYAWLKGLARKLSTQPPREHAIELPEPIRNLDWDAYQAILYRPDHALWRDEPGSAFRAQLFHLGLHFRTPVRIYEVVDGRAHELDYDPSRFDFGESGVDGERLPKDLGYAGFRLHHRDDWKRDVAAFLGASYFRAVSDSMQYGMSARGLAIDTASASREEEFPDFTRFWLERSRMTRRASSSMHCSSRPASPAPIDSSSAIPKGSSWTSMRPSIRVGPSSGSGWRR